MKNLLILSLLAIFHFGVHAQNEVFRIDSLPKEGILLDKGWKFHVGDNPDFAKPEFDDSQWESIDPTKKVVDLPKIKNVKIGWFRIRLSVDSSLQNTILSINSDQTVASEFFINGKFIGNYGKIDLNKNNIVAYHPQTFLMPVIHFYTGEDKQIILSVRFAQQNKNNIPNIDYEPFQLRLLSIRLFETDNKYPVLRNSFLENNYEFRGDFDANSLDFFKTGLFLILSILHFSLYVSYVKDKSNLYFGIGCISLFLFYLYEAIARGYLLDLDNFLTYFKFFWLFALVGYLFFQAAIYSQFKETNKNVFYLLILLSATLILCEFIEKPLSNKVGLLICIFIYLDIARVSFVALKRKKNDAKIPLIGSLIFIVFLVLYFVTMLSPRESRIPEHIFANISYLSVPISITLVLARSFARINYSLELKLVEVQHLSAEKQETLQRQNAELQAALLKGQTIERQRVALDLHDNLGSTLSALWLSVDTIDKSKMNVEEKEIHQNLRENLEKAYNDVRLLSHNLLPEEFEKQGLTTILQGFVRKMNKNSTIKFDLKISENFGRVNNKIEFELYSICLELVNNIIKHSKATEAKIELSRTEKQILLIVSDNGIGTFKNDSDGKGMKNVKARVESLNGVWKLQSIDSEGVSNKILIPV